MSGYRMNNFSCCPSRRAGVQILFGFLFLLVLLVPDLAFCVPANSQPSRISALNPLDQGLVWTEKIIDGLGGEFTRPLPGLETSAESLNFLNYRKNFGLAMDSLSPMSFLIDRPEGFWEGNKTVIVGFCLFIIVQSFIIGFLVRNMVRRREAEEALRDSEESFRLAFQISPDAIMIGRLRDGVYTDVNKGFTFLVGYEKEEVIGKSSRDILLWDNAKQERDFYSTVQEKRFVNNLEAKFRLKDGSIITGLISASLFLRHGEPHVLATIRNIESIKRSENKIRQLAYYDLLTGLPNRSLFFDRLEQALRQARREGWKVGLLFFDLDRFKWVNDTLGHAIGDLLLQKVSQRLQKILRKSDTLARLGGDEFVLLLNCVNEVQNVTAVAQKVQLLMNSPFDLEGKRVQTSSSIGIAIFPQDGEDVETLMKNADLAMYSAKEKERNNFQFFSEELNHKAKTRHDLEQSMSRAMEKKGVFPRLSAPGQPDRWFHDFLRSSDPLASSQQGNHSAGKFHPPG